LDELEFKTAVRKAGQITATMMSDKAVLRLFNAVDTDGSGSVTIEELTTFLWGGSGASPSTTPTASPNSSRPASPSGGRGGGGGGGGGDQSFQPPAIHQSQMQVGQQQQGQAAAAVGDGGGGRTSPVPMWEESPEREDDGATRGVVPVDS
jgi:hypothetical protein